MEVWFVTIVFGPVHTALSQEESSETRSGSVTPDSDVAGGAGPAVTPPPAADAAAQTEEEESEEQSDDDSSPDSTPRPRTASQFTPHLERLWVYASSVTTGHNVSCFAWNKSNKVCCFCYTATYKVAL